MIALLSIKPEFAFKLFSGEKLYEYRRAVFSQPGVERIVVYASSPIMRIIGELQIDQILQGSPRRIWNDTAEWGGVERSLYFKYFDNRRTAYAISVKRAMPYRCSVDPRACFSGFRPPQSFQYIDGANLEIIRIASLGFVRKRSPVLDKNMCAMAVNNISRAIA